MLQARVYGMIENIGGGYLILDPVTRDTRTDDDDDRDTVALIMWF